MKAAYKMDYAALEGTPLPELRARYRKEYLFSPEESVKISDYR